MQFIVIKKYIQKRKKKTQKLLQQLKKVKNVTKRKAFLDPVDVKDSR